MYLFILESIGTSELILIGIVALIVFGPRKLPQMARTLGKMMTEFRSTTNEFKTTWQREASFEEESKQLNNLFAEPEADEKPVREIATSALVPEVRQVDPEEIKRRFETIEKAPEKTFEAAADYKTETDKRDWL